MLESKDFPALTMADLQALLWYPEKRLYDTAKSKEDQESEGYEDDEAPDYANAARNLVVSKGVAEAAVRSAYARIDADVQAARRAGRVEREGDRGRGAEGVPGSQSGASEGETLGQTAPTFYSALERFLETNKTAKVLDAQCEGVKWTSLPTCSPRLLPRPIKAAQAGIPLSCSELTRVNALRLELREKPPL